MMLQLGWKAGTEQFPPTELAEYAVGPDTIKKLACVSPNPDDHVKFAQRYIDLGFTHLIFHSAAPDQRAFIEGYGRDGSGGLPRIRSSAR